MDKEYNPTGPYKWDKKDIYLEILFFKNYFKFISLLKWAREKNDTSNSFRRHLEWIMRAAEKFSLPSPQCAVRGCSKNATFISLRNGDNASASLSHVYCQEHKELADSSLDWKFSSMAELSSHNNIISDFLMYSYLKIKKLDAQKIFEMFKKATENQVPAITIHLTRTPTKISTILTLF